MRCDACQRPQRRCECPKPVGGVSAASEDRRQAWDEGFAAAGLYVQQALLGGSKALPVNPYGPPREPGRDAYERWTASAPQSFEFPAWADLGAEQQLVWAQFSRGGR